MHPIQLHIAEELAKMKGPWSCSWEEPAYTGTQNLNNYAL